MRTLKLAMIAAAAFAFNANAQTVIGMGNPPGGTYQPTTNTDIVGQDLGNPELQVFHAGGVAACDGCHVMHNASPAGRTGAAKSTTTGSVQPWTDVTNAYLLQGGDQSSTCLICHGAPGVSTFQFTIADTSATGSGLAAVAPTNFTPGGDFGWTNVAFSASPAMSHGHNIVAVDVPGFASDNQTRAPGGSYQGGAGLRAFGCHSCHDPHGRYRLIDGGAGVLEFAGPGSNYPIIASGSYRTSPNPTTTLAVGAYRILGGAGYAPASNPTSPFPNDPPIAVAPETYNANESAGEVRVAYGKGMSEWCQNCHTNIHLDGYTTGVAGLRHPAGSTAFLHTSQIDVYNQYVATGNMTGGTDEYTSLVPFEQTELSYAALKGVNLASISAKDTSAVMCLSCHRAHASGFDFMVRWDQNATFLTDSSTYTPGLNADRDDLVTQAAYYGRDVGTNPGNIGPYQRSLCNKCHGKD